jgi:hypothetical protein
MTIVASALITDAALTIGAIPPGGILNTSELNDGLVSLNKLVDAWTDLMLVQLVSATLATGGSGPFTLARPIKIKSARCSSGSISAPVEICSAEQWAEIADNSRSGTYATKLFCDYAYPTSNIYVWPAATASLKLISYMPFTQVATLATSLDLPPGYARALTFNLGLDMSPQFGKPIDQGLMVMAEKSKQDIIATNTRIFGALQPPLEPIPQGQAK